MAATPPCPTDLGPPFRGAAITGFMPNPNPNPGGPPEWRAVTVYRHRPRPRDHWQTSGLL